MTGHGEGNKEFKQTHLPVCSKENFPYWKKRVWQFMDAADPRIPIIVTEGPYVPMTASPLNAEVKIPKKLMEMTRDEIALVALDKRAVNIIGSAVTEAQFQTLEHCTTAKEMWETIITRMEGSVEVRNDRKSLLCGQFEMFKQNPSETIADCHQRFFKLINGLRTYGRSFETFELNDRFLRCLTKDWSVKVCAIKEAADLTKLDPEVLFGKLESYELEMKRHKTEEKEEKEKEKVVALKAESTKKGKECLSLKDCPPDEDEVEASADSDNADSDEELALFTKQFKRMMSRNRFSKNKGSSSSSRKERYVPNQNKHISSNLVCYRCRKPGHLIADCTQKRRDEKRDERKSSHLKKKEERSFVAKKCKTLSDSDSDKSLSEEEAYFGLMANSDSEDYENEERVKVLAHTPLSDSEEDEALGAPKPPPVDPEMIAQFGAILASLTRSKKTVQAQAAKIESLESLKPALAEKTNKLSHAMEDIKLANEKLDKLTEQLSRKEKQISELEVKLTAERNLVAKFSKPSTVLPIIDEISYQFRGGLGYLKDKAECSSSKEKTVFKKAILPTCNLDSENTYGFLTNKSKRFDAKKPSVFKAPYEEIQMKNHGPFVVGSIGNAVKGKHVVHKNVGKKPLDPNNHVKDKPHNCNRSNCCDNKAPPLRNVSPAQSTSNMEVKQEKKKRRYNRFECWCCGKVGHFAHDCWFNPSVRRATIARMTNRVDSSRANTAINKNQGPQHSWAPKVK